MMIFFFFKQKTAYEMRMSDWSSDVCSSDLSREQVPGRQPLCGERGCGESGPLPHEMCECRRVKPRNDKGVVAEVARHTNRSSTRPLQHGIAQHVAAGSKVFRRGAFAFVVADAIGRASGRERVGHYGSNSVVA